MGLRIGLMRSSTTEICIQLDVNEKAFYLNGIAYICAMINILLSLFDLGNEMLRVYLAVMTAGTSVVLSCLAPSSSESL